MTVLRVRDILLTIGTQLAVYLAQPAWTMAKAPDPLMILPVHSSCISSPFGPRLLPKQPLAGTFHNGVDLPAPVGTPVLAVAPGTVIRVQRHGVGGLEMLVQHDGFVGVYSHLGLIAPKIAEGPKIVYAGEALGTVGLTGLTFGPHLYFGMLVNGHPVDPAPYLQVQACERSELLKPVDHRIAPSQVFAQQPLR